MSFDRTTRNALARMVGQVRELLKFDVMDQLRRLGFQADGCVLNLGQIAGLSELERVAGKELRDLLEHFVALESGPEVVRRQAAYDRLAREIGFTTLNRLVALRMAEERGLIVQAVGRGLASDGFQIYERVARDALGNRAETYRSYLECLYDELALDLPMLFDRTTPESRIFPSERCLEEVLSLLNDASLAHLWKEDEAIGWVYQYYNDPDERKKMREVQAPRNSRELAVRNQFFTPRYVVEFLTDNTLGRLWYEMRQGNTQFSDQRRYLVRRPVDIFLQDGEEALQSAEPEEDLSLEELVNRPAFILFRAKKDPRDLTILDPACGSGHFLLYAFDLLETIYEEAWADNSSPISAITGTWLRNDYADLAALRRASPELILRHNLYGIDIDPRACQIAALALWLRAQRSYQQLGLTAAERPQITKSNIVCAEPMSGEREMLEEYLKEHVDPRLHPLVRTIWNKMQLAGEAGSLLKIEEEIKTVLVEAREQALVDTPLIQLSLSQRDQPMQVRLTIPASEERTFWEQAEEKLLAALRDYASKTPNGHLTQRRLFAEDVAQGFAFIDLCRNRFDVILMNPPFGKTSLGAASYIKQAYKDNWKDLYAVFIERCLRLLSQGGMLGAITSSQFLYTKQLRVLRHTLIEQQLVRLLMELGLGVLDSATVETALTVLSNFHTPICGFLDLTEIANKGEALYAAVHPDGQGLLWQHLTRFQKLFNWPLCYHITDDKLSLWDSDHRLEPDLATVVLGNHTFDDERFLRLRWEVAPNTIGTRWFAYEKGGEYQPFIAPPHLLFNWVDNGAEAREHQRARYGTDAQTMQSISWWYKPGLAYSRVSSVGFGPRILPAGSIFSEKGISIFPNSPSDRIPILGLLVSSWTEDLLNAFGRHRAYENSAVANLPFGQDTIAIRESEIASLTLLGIDFVWTHEEGLEPSAFFIMPLSIKSGESYRSHACEVQCQISQGLKEVCSKIDELVAELLFGGVAKETQLVSQKRANLVDTYISLPNSNERERQAEFIMYLIGCCFGRWDARMPIDRSLVPKRQGIFDTLPLCPPGALVSLDGLPAMPDHIVSEEWLRARPDAVTLPPEGRIHQPTITDEMYPIQIAWDGILVDDPEHNRDIIQNIRNLLLLLWPDDKGAHVELIEQEMCEILGSRDLREYFRRPAGFFEDHLKKYSKSKRQAPIYWPLSTISGSYTLWIYCHRLTSDTLYIAVNRYVAQKISIVQRYLAELASQITDATGREALRLREIIREQQDFLGELIDFRDELLRVAALPYRPDLNDGVLINAAPLHRLFRFPKWAKDTKECWEKLQRGEYDWTHLAYTIWSDRVREKCRADRSIAIAHDLEHLYIEQPTIARRKRSRKAVPDKEDEE